MSCAEHAADSLRPDARDGGGAVQARHLGLASCVLEGILLSAYELRHDDAARVLADLLGRLREAAGVLVRR